MFRIKPYSISTPSISKNITIAQISDLHETSFGSGNQTLFQTVAALQPDLIVITGDMLYDTYTQHPNTAYVQAVAAWASSVAPSFFVTGNHERIWPELVKDIFAITALLFWNKTLYASQFAAFPLKSAGSMTPPFKNAAYSKFISRKTACFICFWRTTPNCSVGGTTKQAPI